LVLDQIKRHVISRLDDLASVVRLCSEFSSEAILQLCAIAAAEFGTNVPHLERTDTQTSTKSSKSTKDKNIESKNIIEKIPDSQTSEAFTIGMAELAKLWNQEREFLTLEVWAIMMSGKEERFGEFVLWTKLNRTRVAIVEAIYPNSMQSKRLLFLVNAVISIDVLSHFMRNKLRQSCIFIQNNPIRIEYN